MFIKENENVVQNKGLKGSLIRLKFLLHMLENELYCLIFKL